MRLPASTAFVAAGLTFACSRARDPNDPRTAGTLAMAERLDEIARDAAPGSSADAFYARIAQTKSTLSSGAPIDDEARVRLSLALDLLKAGDPEGAVAEAERATACAERDRSTDAVLLHELTAARATAWLRIGELENCVACCNGASCLAPIAAAGVHSKRRGSEHALVEFEKLLAEDPGDAESRWLLNLVHMTLGSWPDAVPAQWRLDPSAFESEYPLPRWTNVAAQCGVAGNAVAGGAVAEDFDGDGFIDLMVSSQGLRDPLHFYRNDGDGHFTERTHEAGLDGELGGLNLTHADYDNDGHPDVLVLRGAWLKEGGCIPHSLLRNRGDGTFDDVTEQAGMLSAHPTQTACWADFDGDGWLDVFLGNESYSDKADHPCELYQNQRDGTFKDVATETGVALRRFVKGVCAGDYDDDGRPDLYVSCREPENALFHNEPAPGGAGFRFRDVTAEAGVQRPEMSFPCWFFDYDNDGRLDLLAAPNAGFGKNPDDVGKFLFGEPTESDRPALYHNEGNGRFRDVAREVGLDRAILVMGANYGDLDNDGWLDVYLTTGNPSFRALLPNRMFRNDHGRRFQDVTTAGGFGHLQKGHAVAFADFDNDGDQDLFHNLGGQFPGDTFPDALFENPGNANHWLTLQLRGVKANRCAIGARIRVDVETPDGARSIHLLAGTGGSFGSSSLQQEIGLGDAERVRALTIRWPGSNTVQTFADIAMDRVWLAVEGAAQLEPIAVPRIKLGKGGAKGGDERGADGSR